MGIEYEICAAGRGVDAFKVGCIILVVCTREFDKCKGVSAMGVDMWATPSDSDQITLAKSFKLAGRDGVGIAIS